MRSLTILSIFFIGLQLTLSTGYELYNWNKNVCCNGNIYPKKSSDGKIQKCCGDKIIPAVDPGAYTKCCNGEIYISLDSFDNNLVCCNKDLINTTKEVCFNNTDHKEISDSDKKAKKTQICGKSFSEVEFYSPRKHECCEGQLFDKELKMQCLGPDYVSNKNKIICHARSKISKSKVHSLDKQNPQKIQCCGLEIYNTGEKVCVMNKIVEENEEITKHCCGCTYSYNWTSHRWNIMEYKNEGDEEDCGQFISFNDDYICKNNILYQPSKDETICNWISEKYNSKTQACCFSQIVNLTEEAITDGKFQCCEEGPLMIENVMLL